LNRLLVLPDSGDELVAEHELTEEENSKPSFLKLVRRSREDGLIRWTIAPDEFPSPGLQEGSVQIKIPPCELDGPLDWCVLVEQTIAARSSLNPVIWKLDLVNGRVDRLQIPIESTPKNPEVASDGQTVVFFDDGLVRYVYPGGGGGSSRVRQGNNTELIAWHPEKAMRTLLQFSYSSEYLHVLPRARVFVTNGGDTVLNVHIIPLDGSPLRQLFP
jgi:hypothetical protein